MDPQGAAEEPIREAVMAKKRRYTMKGTYKAVEASTPGTLRLTERPVSGAGQVRIRVEACGICHSDMFTVTEAAS